MTMKQDTIDKGLFRIYLGIICIVIAITMHVSALTFYYWSSNKEVYPALTMATGELFLTGTTLLGFGVYKHVKTGTKPPTGP